MHFDLIAGAARRWLLMAFRAGVRVKQRPETIFRDEDALKHFLSQLELCPLLQCQPRQGFSRHWFFVRFTATQQHAQNESFCSFGFHSESPRFASPRGDGLLQRSFRVEAGTRPQTVD